MDNIDEQLLSGQNRKKGSSRQSAPERAGALKQARRGKSGNPDSSGQDNDQADQPETLREAARAEKARQAKENSLKDKAVSAAAAPINRGTSKLLQQAWVNLIDSFGLTLIWINIHAFLSAVLGEKIFCKLGDEWLGNLPPELASSDKVQKKTKMIKTIEPMGLACLDLVCLFVIIAVFSLVAMILGVISNPMEAIKNLLVGLWGIMTDGK